MDFSGMSRCVSAVKNLVHILFVLLSLWDHPDVTFSISLLETSAMALLSSVHRK